MPARLESVFAAFQRRRAAVAQPAVLIEELRAEFQRQMRELRTEVEQMRADVLPLVSRASDRAVRRAARAERRRRIAIAVFLRRYLAAKVRQADEVGAAFEGFGQAMRSPLPRRQISLLGGRARAKSAFRGKDGTFLSTAEVDALLDEIAAEEYERHAPGGRARAAGALRGSDGRFQADR